MSDLTPMWNIEKDLPLRSTIVTVLLLDQAPTRPAGRQDRAARGSSALASADRDAAAAHRSAAVVGRRELDLRYHLRRVKACEPTIDAVLDLARTSAMAGFDRA
jgi:hypothetical protein